MYVLINDDDYFIVDPSCKPSIVRNYFFNNSLIPFENLRGVFMTHGHFDHVMYVDEWKSLFPNVPFYIGMDDIELLDDPSLNCSADFSSGISFGTDVISYESLNNHIDISDSFFCDILNTPGHTEGQVVIIFHNSSDEPIMFTGDMLFRLSIGRTDFVTGNIQKMNSSIELLKGLSYDALVFPGHGPSTQLAFEIANNPYF